MAEEVVLAASEPSYVRREVDQRWHDRLRDVDYRGGLALLVGPPLSGRSRCLTEAVRAVFPAWSVHRPRDVAAVRELAAEAGDLTRTVVVLDDLEDFLTLDSSGIDWTGLLEPGSPVVMAAIDADRYRQLVDSGSASRSLDPLEDRHAKARHVLHRAKEVVWIDGRLSRAELAAADAAGDPRIAAALADRNRFVRRLAGPAAAALDAVEGADRFGTAILAAATDCRRLGLPPTLGGPLLAELAAVYLADDREADTGWFAAAASRVAPALRPVPGGWMLDRRAAYGLYRDRLVTPVPPEAWTVLERHVEDGWDLFALANAARGSFDEHRAERLYRRAHLGGHPLAIRPLFDMLVDRGELAEAAVLCRDVVAAGTDYCGWAAARLGIVLLNLGEIAEAEQVIRQRIADVEHRSRIDPRHHLVDLLEAQGRHGELEACYRDWASAGAPSWWLDKLVELLRAQRRTDEAIAVLRASIDAGNPYAWRELGKLLTGTGRTAEAIDLYRTVLTEHGDSTAGDLLRRLSPDEPEAELAYRAAIDGGHNRHEELVELLLDENRLDDALAAAGDASVENPRLARWLLEAGRPADVIRLEFHSTEAMHLFGEALRRVGRFDEAAEWFSYCLDEQLEELGRYVADDPATDAFIDAWHAIAITGRELTTGDGLIRFLTVLDRTEQRLAFAREARSAGLSNGEYWLRDALRDAGLEDDAAELDRLMKARHATRGDEIYELRQRGEDDQALALARVGVAAGEAHLRRHVAELLHARGDAQGAIDAYRDALAHGERFRLAGFVELLEEAGHAEEAIAIRHDAYLDEPNIDARQGLVELLLRHQHAERAVALLRDALAANPYAFEALVDLLVGLDRPAEAVEACRVAAVGGAAGARGRQKELSAGLRG